VIAEGVSAGDRIVVEGTLKARPGTPLKPTVVTDAELQGAAGPPSPAA
jgi:hypothetical protein